ncbi:MAG: hypothetical protein A2836_03515 [Candidatus Taylorbacteria bacterium RIFCSPHIGHO2_01_FULL_45_63]|uniref:Glycosidase n=1 Tax=Candidatus Taylorbacteria bacterium RIFCSPHIGHO2_02_FULL_45_35 TaxID=1802311 RepID=A0A1G2MTM7_9BACT|nr:MAG: hypothetical protein A2836_03515 [Candidatus Taylorbacteria bacterium RIFCSPHIGHO2_01_FULL_45_63]OHA27250.1 MAG: hypothetical protein A3D56_00345 [Candidatus Taylorbacteria bacterium RIFCSPHIGHO2_02_FULL_45_35]OHA33182.1 MAG: hypothetical protein A3A22_00090 [Candidatus Taylorbacteria bacterium RIFCSPLOWO2_01_FULL_45_34b]
MYGMPFNLTTITAHIAPIVVKIALLFIVAILVSYIIYIFWLAPSWKRRRTPPSLKRSDKNPVLKPISKHWWESEAVFNPAAVVDKGIVHLFYRALGKDGISRIGYAKSHDGIHFERLPYPVFVAENVTEARKHYPYTSPARLTYDTETYTSGGGWGGAEDPRAVKMNGRIFLTFNMFNGWESMRVALTSIDAENLAHKRWNWRRFSYLSEPNTRHKNWVLFPEKISGKYALIHSLYAKDPEHIQIKLLDEIEMSDPIKNMASHDPQRMATQKIAWHERMRSAGPPPIKTKYGWLLFYHAMDKEQHRYKLGALLLHLQNPTKVLYRSLTPVLEPDEWYENDGKPGIVYASGTVVLGNNLIVYYGGGDKYVAAAKTNLNEFLKKLISHGHTALKLEPVKL